MIVLGEFIDPISLHFDSSFQLALIPEQVIDMALKRKRMSSSLPTSSAPTDGSALSSTTGSASSMSPPSEASEDAMFSDGLISFAYDEIKEATAFNPQYAIGSGSNPTVYKGKLKRIDKVVAIKAVSGTEKDFVAEVALHSLLNHGNIIRIIGISSKETDRHIILEYMPGGSLFDQLHNWNCQMLRNWKRRLTIAAGVASALDYLHNLGAPVIHGDVKSANILLDNSWIPKLSDFGSSLFVPTGAGSESGIQIKSGETAVGTLGYLDPEYNSTETLTTKSDVYSFGVVLLELLTGRKARDLDEAGRLQELVPWVNDTWEESKDIHEFVDSKLAFSEPSMLRTTELAFLCLAEKGKDRPTMQEVVSELHKIKEGLENN